MTLLNPIKNPLIDWYQTAAGIHYKEQIHHHLLHSLKQNPNQKILQMGPFDFLKDLATIPTTHIIHLLNNCQAASNIPPSLFSKFDCLPIHNESIQIVLLPHVLEIDTDYRSLLNESWRVLDSNGYLAIIGINPWSLWSLQRIMQPETSFIPAFFQLHSAQTIRYHLRELGAEIILSTTLNYQEPASQYASTWLNNLAQLLLPSAGSLFLIIAKKSIIPATLIKMKWNWQNLAPKTISEPTTGNIRRG